ncbi:MAG: hypothetical protein ABR992_17285 [Solirubrobacteraceae bacterium]
MKAPVDAVVWLKPPILLDGTLAGQSFKVRMNNRAMTLTLPLESVEREEPRRPSTIPPFPPPDLAEGFNRGSAASRVSRAIAEHELSAGAMRLRFSDAPMRRKLDSVYRHALSRFDATEDFLNAVESWLSTVRDWLYAWAARPGHELLIPPRPEFRLALPNQPERGTVGGGGSITVIVLGERAATRVEWESALRAASAGERLPLPYRLLSEAIAHRTGLEPRNAVITACSAAEVALGELARAGLKAAGWPPSETKEILKTANGLIDLYRVCAALPDRPPVSIGEVMSKLANPRNLAAHEGKDPGGEVVGDAIVTSTKIVRISPLPRPESFAP